MNIVGRQLPAAAAKAAVAALVVIALAGACGAGYASLPPYRTSGAISGTGLLYDNLRIDNKGRASLVISNPGNTGESFVAVFSFYTQDGVYLTGFTIKGFAGRKSSSGYALNVPNHAKLRGAAYMKTLGRAGRSGEN